jgi:parvulin-like peptidyl-prolyl isomerase
MQNSKLYSILERFDKYEQNRLKKFLTSPYFNRNEALVMLYDLLVGHINEKTQGKSQTAKPEPELEKTELWEKIYPGESFDDVLFRKNCSDLLKLIEDFLAQQVYEENPINQATFLIEAVAKKKLDKLYNSTMKSARRLTEQQPYRNANYYLAQFQVEKNYFDILGLEHDRTSKKNEEEILNNLDRFFIAEKLRVACSVLSQKILVSHEYTLLLMDDIVAEINRHGFAEVPPISVYYQIYLTYVDAENADHYFKLMNILEKFGDSFPRNEAEFIYQAALNYCVKKLNQGSRQFLEEYFNVFNILLTKELILVDGELSPWHFRNIVVIALRLGKYEWTGKFINTYKSYLPESMRENAVSYNLAQLYFSQKRFDKVVELLRTVEYDDITYNLNSKTMLLSTYYETDEIEPLYSLMDSFRTYLNRHKDFAASRRILYTNLIKFTKQLTKIIPGDKKALDKLKKEVEEAEPKGIASITWLKEKIAELE